MANIGKTEKGKVYHIVNRMTGSGNSSLCGCYMPKDKLVDGLNPFELYKKNEICSKCMHIAYYKQDRD